MCLLPVWAVTLVRHEIARLQQQNFMQLQNESINIRHSKENPQSSPVVLGQLLLELWREALKRVLKDISSEFNVRTATQTDSSSSVSTGVKLLAPAVSDFERVTAQIS